MSYEKANKIESALIEAISRFLESKEDIAEAKKYFEDMSVNDFIDQESEYIGEE